MSPAVLPALSRGFSLVELSIVLVILGLLVGGILSGQALIRASELRSITTQSHKFVTAVHTFRDKYFQIPGDMQNATTFWGAAHATPATCYSTVGTGTQTCNGNGNGWINAEVTTSNEVFRFWQHLANAGLIEGTYTGVLSATHIHSTDSGNAPSGRLSTSLWFAWNWGNAAGATYGGSPTVFAGSYANTLMLGGYLVDYSPNAGLLTPEELWNIDTKADDGKPAMGKVVVFSYNGISNCTTTVANNPATITADYLLTSTAKQCGPIFRQVF